MFLRMQIHGLLDENDAAAAVDALRCVRGVLHANADPCNGHVEIWYEGAHLDASTLVETVQRSGASGLAVTVEAIQCPCAARHGPAADVPPNLGVENGAEHASSDATGQER
jgi:hypothetical protein